MIVLAFFGGIVGIVSLLVLGSIWRGYVLSVMWGWFIVPTFGLPKLHIVAAIGVSMVVSYLTHQVYRSKKETDDDEVGKDFLKSIAYTIGIPLFTLFFGWIVHMFM